MASSGPIKTAASPSRAGPQYLVMMLHDLVLDPLSNPSRLSCRDIATRTVRVDIAAVSAGNAPGLVAIGASAGGIEAFHQFFAAMPADSGLAFVVVLHLAAGRKSMLPEILARWTTMPVAEAQDGAPIAANLVLVIPAGTVAELRDGRLLLRETPPDVPRSMTPIDAFFDSVAASMTEHAIGIILSGTGHDGSLGLKAIKARGGLTLAQGGDGSGPEYPDMPNSAVAAGAVDLYVRVGSARKFGNSAPFPPTVSSAIRHSPASTSFLAAIY
jgi:chemotaxis response regulator CheB